MQAEKSFAPVAASQTGMLRMTDGCPALCRNDGTRFWLEMDSIPQHLFDTSVKVEGVIHQQYLIVVDRIGPLNA